MNIKSLLESVESAESANPNSPSLPNPSQTPPRTNTQRFFLEHDDDVTAVAVHPTLDIVASGQLCRKAFVLLYDVTSTNDEGISFINELNLGNNTRGVKCLDFSPDGAQLLSVAADPYHTVTIWDWKRGIKLVSARANNAEVFR